MLSVSLRFFLNEPSCLLQLYHLGLLGNAFIFPLVVFGSSWDMSNIFIFGWCLVQIDAICKIEIHFFPSAYRNSLCRMS